MSSRRISLVDSAIQTATGQGASKAIPTLTMGTVFVDITAATAVTDFTCFLQGSDDGGTTWFDLVADQVALHTGTVTGGAITVDDRDIHDGATAVSAAVAVYKHLPVDYVRIAWTLAGTNITFSATLIGK